MSGPAPRLYGAQADGCAPIVRLVESGGEQIEPVIPNTIARSIAIGNPADGRFAAQAIRRTGGWAAGVTDEELVGGHPAPGRDHRHLHRDGRRRHRGRRARARPEGRLRPEDEVVLCITGNGLKTVEALQGALPEAPDHRT